MNDEITSPSFLAHGTEKSPIKNEPAEFAVIGAFIRDDSKVTEALATAPAKTWRGRVGFVAMEYERRLLTGESLDAVSVATALSSEYPHVGALMAEAYDSVPHAGRVLENAGYIAEANRRYELRLRTQDFFNTLETHCELESEVANFQDDLQRLTESAAAEEVTPSPKGIASVLSKWESPQSRGIPTGYRRVDRLIGGWQKGRLYLVAAPTGIGKSAVAGNSAWHVARDHSVLFCSLEMPSVEVFERGLCSELRLTKGEIVDRMESPDSVDAITKSMNSLSERRMFVDDRTGRNVAQIAAQVRKHKRRHGLDLLVVDYIQLVAPMDRKATRNDQLGEISRGLKLIAKNLDIPVVALSQLSRAGSGEGTRPQLHHLRDSGCLEQDADVVMFIHRARDSDDAELLIEKNRSGPTGSVKMTWNREYVRYDEVVIIAPHAQDFGDD